MSPQSSDGVITSDAVPRISFSDLEFGDELGKGAFGSVYKGYWKSKSMTVAIKRVPGKINRQEVSAVVLLFNFYLTAYTVICIVTAVCKSYDCYLI